MLKRAVAALFAWALWAFLLSLVGSQFLGIVWNTSERTSEVSSSLPLASGVRSITESDESPYSDRAIACMLNKRRFVPKQLHLAIRSRGVAASSIDGGSNGVNGFRVLLRDNQLTLSDDAQSTYATMCDVMASIVDSMLNSCESLGYNATRDALRVVAGVDNSELVYLPDSLPVLILPFADSFPYARIAVPGWDGHACMFQLEGANEESATASAIAAGASYYMIGASREDREAVIAQRVHSFTGATSGKWRNGWYEVELSGDSSSKWFGDAISSDKDPTAEVPAPQRQFKLQACGEEELDCSVTNECKPIATRKKWSLPTITMDVSTSEFTKVAVMNASRFGGSYERSRVTTRISSQYDLATFISDVSVLAGLLRWGAALAALHLPYLLRGQIPCYNASIGVLSCSRSFNFIPILLLPRLRVLLAAFATIGLGGHAAQSAGDQSVLVDAWFVIYPATAGLLVYFYCLLNWVGILFKRRTTDALFGPTLIALCLVHYCRDALTHVWFQEDTTRSLPIEASTFDRIGLFPLIGSDMLVRLNGGGSSREGATLFALKLALLGVNVLPLLVPSRFTSFQARSHESSAACATEQTLAFRASKFGGLGVSELYEPSDSKADDVGRLTRYEVARLGYILVGGSFLVSISDWYKLVLLSPMRFMQRPTNIRVMIFIVDTSEKGSKDERNALSIRGGPIIVRVNDQRVRSVKLTDISVVSFQ